MAKRFLPAVAGVLLGVIFLAGGRAFPQADLSSGENDFMEAKAALAAAREARADQYAPEALERAEGLLLAAEKARASDGVKFSQASRLSRAYSELARSIGRLKMEEGRLAAAREDLRKARAEVEALKKNP